MDLNPLLALLTELNTTQNLRLAASNQVYSYRKAWNLLKESGLNLAISLVEKMLGRGNQIN